MGMNYSKNLSKGTVERSRFYSGMGGVDFSQDPSQVSTRRWSYLENMYRDYEADGAGVIESVPGFRILANLGGRVRKMFLQKCGQNGEHLLIATEDKLYRLPIEERDKADALTLIGELEGGAIFGFPFGDAFFLVSGETPYRVDKDGILSKVGFSEGEVAPYIPTTYKNGVAHEQRNLLSTRFYESTTLTNPDDFCASSEGLLFEITDEAVLSCALAGRRETDTDTLYVPSVAKIGNKNYRVVSVKAHAFDGDVTLREVHFSEGLERIEASAFQRCEALECVVLPHTLTSIETGAFQFCPSLSYIYFGEGLESVGEAMFDGCTSLQSLCFASSESLFHARFPTDPFPTYEKIFSRENTLLCIDLPIRSRCRSVLSLSCDEQAIAYETLSHTNGEIRGVRVRLEDKRLFVGVEFTILGEYAEVNTHASFLNDADTDRDAPLGCRVCELFDGRIFLAGNPAYPNTVFYTHRDRSGAIHPLYFGVYNRFDDGIGSFCVNALLSVGNTLAVFKENDDGSGSIFYHTPKETGEDLLPKVYPVSDLHSGLLGLGAVISYYDEPIFVSESGICALKKATHDSERSVRVRSHRIHPRLLCENLGEVSLAKWCGYLVVMIRGQIFLADYRQFSGDSNTEGYEWYYLNGIGTYEGDTRVYRYHSAPAEGYTLGLADEICEGTVFSEQDADGTTHYYIQPGPFKYEVYATEERRGGVFSPATQAFACGKLLFFTTENGTLCLFNNDKRGKAPDTLTFGSDQEKAEYEKHLGRRIHHSYYDFASHAPHYALATKADNCDIPHLEKDSVRDSLTLKCHMEGAGESTLRVKTDRDAYASSYRIRGGTTDFSETDFSSFVFSADEFVTVACRGRVRKFVEKEVSLSSDAFDSPLVLSSIAYRYTVRGKIKND